MSSTSRILVSDGSIGQRSSDAPSTEDQCIAARMDTYVQLGTDTTVLAPAAAQPDTTVAALGQVVRVTAVPHTTVLAVAGALAVLMGAVVWGSGVIQRVGRRVDVFVFDDPAGTVRF